MIGFLILAIIAIIMVIPYDSNSDISKEVSTFSGAIDHIESNVNPVDTKTEDLLNVKENIDSKNENNADNPDMTLKNAILTKKFIAIFTMALCTSCK